VHGVQQHLSFSLSLPLPTRFRLVPTQICARRKKSNVIEVILRREYGVALKLEGYKREESWRSARRVHKVSPNYGFVYSLTVRHGRTVLIGNYHHRLIASFHPRDSVERLDGDDASIFSDRIMTRHEIFVTIRHSFVQFIQFEIHTV